MEEIRNIKAKWDRHMMVDYCERKTQYYCDQKISDTNVIVLSYILKRPLCINNLNFNCVNFENVNVRFTEKIFKKF
jgi:hypothetical protein